MAAGVKTILNCASNRTRFNLFAKSINCSHQISIKSISTSHNQFPKLFAIWSWKKKDAEADKNAPEFTIEPEEKVELTEEQILEKRNKSRLRSQHQRLLNNEVPYPTPAFWTHHTVKYKKRMYAIYGEMSGENPGLMWPTEEDLEARLEYEKVAHPFTLQEMVERKKEYRRLEAEEFVNRAKEVESKMLLVEKMKQDIFDKRAAKEREVAAARAKRELLMEEVRRHFGYTVDPRDERFQELLEKKEKAQKKALKEAKKAERQKMLLAKLTEGLDSKDGEKSKDTAMKPPPPKPEVNEDEK